MWKKDTDTLRRYLMICLILLAALAIAVLLYRYGPPMLTGVLGFLGKALFPFAFAWVAAIFTRPLVDLLCRCLRLPRSLAVLLAMILCIGTLTLLLAALAVVIIYVVGEAVFYINQQGIAFNLLTSFSHLLDLDLGQFSFLLNSISGAAGNLARQALSLLLGLIKATPAAFLLVLVTLVATFYWCRDEETVKRLLAAPFPRPRRHSVLETYDVVSRITANYLRAQLLLVAISILICVVGFYLLCVPRALALGLLAGGLNMIPMLGPGTLLLPWGLWLIFTGQHLLGVGLLSVFIAVLVVHNIIQPKIVGDRVGLHPLVALAALFLGLRCFGVVGLLLGPVVASLALALYQKRKRDNPPLGTG